MQKEMATIEQVAQDNHERARRLMRELSQMGLEGRGPGPHGDRPAQVRDGPGPAVAGLEGQLGCAPYS